MFVKGHRMVSKTALLEAVRAFDWKAVDAGLREKPRLVKHRDERGRNWLHVCCATSLNGRDRKSSIRTADVLLTHGVDLRDYALTEGRWRATPVWYCVAFGSAARQALTFVREALPGPGQL